VVTSRAVTTCSMTNSTQAENQSHSRSGGLSTLPVYNNRVEAVKSPCLGCLQHIGILVQ
jgi:hypothetical protein